MNKLLLSLLTAFILVSCNVQNKPAGENNAVSTAPVELLNPALPGDNPDPSVILVGDTYYATSTTNEWAPYFTIYKSTDLQNWELVNHVFPNGFKDMKDEWGENNFWASELAYDADQNRIYAYYTAHNRKVEGNPGLQCGVAWINVDEIETGKFVDNGPVIVEDDCGAIDAFEFKDQGKIYVFWKNDGNGCGKESWIWMQEINEDRTQLLGQKKKMYTNSQPWENALVEGASFFRMDDYIYSLYSVGGCCDARCDYKTGIARTKGLASGEWEKYDKNPIMISNENWRCPGHGTVVQSPDGRYYMMYHAFNMDYDVFVGREGVIEELTIAEDGWPVLHNATVPNRPKADLNFKDNFAEDTKLSLVWQWPSKYERPVMKFEEGLHLQASNTNHELGTFIGQFTKTVNYSIRAKVQTTNAHAGLCLGGAFFESEWPGELGGIGISVSNDELRVYNTFDGKYEVIKQTANTLSGEVELKMDITNDGTAIDFFYKQGNADWVTFHSVDFDAAKYVPWGMGYRIGLVAKGDATESAVFKNFALENF